MNFSYSKAMLLCVIIITSLVMFTGCPKTRTVVNLKGKINNYNAAYEYEIRLVESTELSYKVLDYIEDSMIVNGKFDYEYTGVIDYNTQLEFVENDTVRAILMAGEGNYLRNPMTKDIFYYEPRTDKGEIILEITDIQLEMDHSPLMMLDYNMGFIIRPTLDVAPDYKNISGRLDTLPPETRLVLITDGGYSADRYEFLSPEFETKTDYKINYLDMYMESKHGWRRHLQRYDVEKIK